MAQLRTYIASIVASIGITGDWADIAIHLALVVVVILIAAISYYICHRLLTPLVIKVTKKTDIEWDDIIFNSRTMHAACKIVPAVVVWKLLPDTFFRFPSVMELLARLTAIYITVTSVWLALAVINSLKLLESDSHSSLQQYLHTFCGVLKIAAIFAGVIVTVAIIIDRSPMTLFAGLGATSAILMLVFKDAISGLVAGIRLTSNDMLQKGDWITVPKADINGIVQDITLTTVKVRNFDNTIITITPQTLVDDSFQNWKGMQQGGGRRVKRIVYFDFRSIRIADDDLKQSLAQKHYLKQEDMQGEVVNMTLFRRYTERWLAAQADVNTDYIYMVRQLEATPTGLPLEIYFFLRQKEWKPYEQQLANTLEHIYATIPDFGLRIYQRCAANCDSYDAHGHSYNANCDS